MTMPRVYPDGHNNNRQMTTTAEVLWCNLKHEWLRPEDHTDKETLRLAGWQAFAAVGRSMTIQF
jgi:hypothetical protein